jgi:hypothetical protein
MDLADMIVTKAKELKLEDDHKKIITYQVAIQNKEYKMYISPHKKPSKIILEYNGLKMISARTTHNQNYIQTIFHQIIRDYIGDDESIEQEFINIKISYKGKDIFHDSHLIEESIEADEISMSPNDSPHNCEVCNLNEFLMHYYELCLNVIF